MSSKFREYRLRIECVTTTPLAASAGTESDVSDSALRRRADGTLVVPGTSIAGALRSAVERMAKVDRTAGDPCAFVSGRPRQGAQQDEGCRCPVCALFGDVRPGMKDAAASRIRVFDSVVRNAAVRIADGVAIDRGRRSAAAGRKYDFEEMYPGARVAFELRSEPAANLTEEELGWLIAALELVATGHVPLGGRAAAGQGVVEGTDLQLQWRDPSDPDHLLAVLLKDGASDAAWPGDPQHVRTSSLAAHVRVAQSALREDYLKLALTVAADSSFLVGDPVEAVRTGYDTAPLGGVIRPEMTGRALRGALRSSAERILRTMEPAAACDPLGPSACARKYTADRDQAGGTLRPETFSWCAACAAFGNEEWASRVRVRVARDTSVTPYAMPFDHVSIDRFTGGAMDGRKFDRLAVRSAKYGARVSLNHVPDVDRPWIRALVGFVVQDLMDGWITVGRGSAVGHGWFDVEVADGSFNVSDADVEALWKRAGADRQLARVGA